MGRKREVHVRFARSSDAIYLDLCDDRWRAVEVTKDDWRIVDNPPVFFKRPSGARALPIPLRGGSLTALRQLVNCGDDSQWVLMVSWLTGAFLPQGAFSHLVLEGDPGSAKSTTATILQSLIDPSDAGLSAPPRDESDATISGLNTGVLAYDNLSGCRAELSDVFCRFSTGQGYKTRTLYETLGLTVASVKLPVLLNGVDAGILRGDLMERCIALKLPRITPSNRKTESDVWQMFAEIHPGCLGALLDAVSTGLRNLPSTQLDDPPRMADFARWLVSCEPALPWQKGEFLKAYRRKQVEANLDLVEGDQVASAIAEWAEVEIREGGFADMGAKNLLIALNRIICDTPKDLRRWPANPESLAHRLRRIGPILRARGLEVEHLPRTKKAWSVWRITRIDSQMGLNLAA
jgi:hypothetical protein